MQIPAIDRDDFTRRLREAAPEPLAYRAVDALWEHFELLREWGRGMSLIGPGTAAEVIERHYGESLAALEWIEPGRPGKVLDVGSGAGFPGLVLAAARPKLEVWLAESRQRKWAFLRAATARAALSCRCLDARVSASLPAGIPRELDFVTLRAVKLPPATRAALLSRLSPGGAMLWWRGAEAVDLPAGWEVRREITLRGSERRRIVEVRRAP